jgi:hypothetical protein
MARTASLRARVLQGLGAPGTPEGIRRDPSEECWMAGWPAASPPPLQPIQQGACFPQGEGDHAEALALKGTAGAGWCCCNQALVRVAFPRWCGRRSRRRRARGQHRAGADARRWRADRRTHSAGFTLAQAGSGGLGGDGGDGRPATHQHNNGQGGGGWSGRGRGGRWQLGVQPGDEQGGSDGAVKGAADEGKQQGQGNTSPARQRQ